MEKHGMIDRQMETKRVKSLNRNYLAEKSAETVANFMQAGVLFNRRNSGLSQSDYGRQCGQCCATDGKHGISAYRKQSTI